MTSADMMHYNVNDTEGYCKAEAFSSLEVMPLVPHLARQAELLCKYNLWKFCCDDNVIKQCNERNVNGAGAHVIT